MQSKLVILIAVAASVLQCFSCAMPATPSYVKTGECESTAQHCRYSYTARQQYFDSGEEGDVEIKAEIDITCISSGIHNEASAKLYCMDIKSAKISGNLMQNATDEEIRGMQQSMTKLLSRWFCFVQNSHGKIAAVYHSTSENNQAITFKKGVAAAFQANFDDTEEEEETDPGSTHTSHYTHVPTEEGKMKMRRVVHGNDVHEFASNAPKSDVEMEKDEEIEYESGHLVHSAGNMTVRFVNESDDTEDEKDEPSISNMFSASGWYDLELRSCHKTTGYMFGVQKKKIDSNMRNSMEEDLKATIDERAEALQEMKLLRERFPSGSVIEVLRHYKGDQESDKLVEKLKRLIELESEYGTQSSYTPAINEILAFIEHIPSTEPYRKLREAVVMLLSADGSLRSQLALLNALDNASDSLEANSILTHISFLDWASLDLVVGLEDHLRNLNPKFNDSISDQLLLVYGSLTTKGSEEVEIRVMNYLNTVSLSINSQSDLDLSQSILVVHALGNTGSESSLRVILGFLHQNSESKQMQLAVIDALSKLTEDNTVLTLLEEFLVPGISDSEEYVAAVVETLDHGFEYVENRQQSQVAEYITHLKAHSILFSIVRVSASINSTDLHMMVVDYFKKINSRDFLFEILEGEIGARAKRQTSDWDSTKKSDYNHVASLSTRKNDVKTYSRHSAYITSKTIGISKANIKIASGYFAGISRHCDKMKAFGRSIVKGRVLSKTATLADFRFRLTATTTSISVSLYAKIGTNTLLNFNFKRALKSHCKRHSRPITQHRRRLFKYSIPIFIYVGTLRFSIGLYGHLKVHFNTNVCIGRKGTEISGALGALTPNVGASFEGSVSASLLEAVRGGITASASFSYQIEPAASVQACTAYCRLSARLCIGIYDSWPNNKVSLDTWYQIRKPGICKKKVWGVKVPYPCLKWGKRRRWDKLSKKWNLGSRGRRALYQRCKGKLHRTCAAGALNSPLFKY